MKIFTLTATHKLRNRYHLKFLYKHYCPHTHIHILTHKFCCIFKKDDFSNVKILHKNIRLNGININYLNTVLKIKFQFIVYLAMLLVDSIIQH
jgi:hypothetical protein